jgi:hypothetical protein
LATISSSFLTSGSSVKDDIAIGTKTNPASQEAVFRRNFEKSILKSSTGNDSSGIGHIGEFLGLVAGLFRESKTGLVKVLAPKMTREPSENAVQTKVKKGEPSYLTASATDGIGHCLPANFDFRSCQPQKLFDADTE